MIKNWFSDFPYPSSFSSSSDTLNPFYLKTSLCYLTIKASVMLRLTLIGHTRSCTYIFVVFERVSKLNFSSAACWSIMNKSPLSSRRDIINPLLNYPITFNRLNSFLLNIYDNCLADIIILANDSFSKFFLSLSFSIKSVRSIHFV